MQQVMTKNVPRLFQISWLYSIKIWVEWRHRALSKAQALPGMVIRSSGWTRDYAVTTGHLNHAILSGEFETKWYVESLPKKGMWNGYDLSGTCNKEHSTTHTHTHTHAHTRAHTHTHTHLASYPLVKIKLSFGVHKIAGCDKTTEWI